MNSVSISSLFEHHFLPEIKDQIRELKSFLQTTESFLSSLHRIRLDEFIREEEKLGVATLPDGTSLEEYFGEHYLAWPEGRLTILLRQSFLVSNYAFIEYSLLDICRFIRRRDVKVSVSDVKGQNDIDKAKIYIAKVLCADFPSNSSSWAAIQTLRRIRNCIVHSRGEVEEGSSDRKLLEDYIKANKGLLLFSGNKIVLERDFCERMLQVTKEFFTLLEDSLMEFIKKNEDILEPPDREFGEMYLGPNIRVWYVPTPDRKKF